MQFANPQAPVLASDIELIERELGLQFPEAVRQCYLKSNGGVPELYVFTNDDVDTVVSELLPLVSKTNGTAIDCYRQLVLSLKLVPESLFPFAVDGGGDYFFVNCANQGGNVFFYRGDASKNDRLVDLKMSFDEFWGFLKPE